MTTIQDEYGLTRVINAAGTFTPVGVSRSAPAVARAAGAALAEFLVIDELQVAAGQAIARFTGAESGAVSHCAASAITVAIAAAMAGTDADKVAALPDTTDCEGTKVVIPAGHVVDYGHSILQDIRLAGAEPVIVGTNDTCTPAELATALDDPETACLLLVSSRLVRGAPLDYQAAADAAHARDLPVFIDGAAQDFRIAELLDSGADLVLVSAQKYLAAPTAGLVIGARQWVAAVRAQEKGIGRSMKASKEAVIGVMAAIAEREAMDQPAWRQEQADKVADFVARAGRIPGIAACSVADPTGLPFPRAHLAIDEQISGRDAAAMMAVLKDGDPSIWVMGHGLPQGELILELVPLEAEEVATILARIGELVS